MRKFLLVFIFFVLASCKLGPDYKMPEIKFSDLWHGNTQATKNVPLEENELWWKIFKDPVLNDLMDQAAEHNHDIRIAVASIEEARALRSISAGSLWPEIGGNTNAEKQGLSTRSSNNNNNNGAKERDTFSADLDASWELDIFGKNRRSVEVAEAELEAAEENKRDVMIAILAEVARNYFEVRGLQKRIAVTEHNIELFKEVEGMAEARVEQGVVTELDLASARGERESAESTLPNLQADMAAGIYRLSVLTGQVPETYLDVLERHAPLPAPPDVVPVGLRSDLLKRRPDVRKAERELAAATAGIGAAKADLFPSFSLTGAVGSSASVFSDLFTGEAATYSIGQAINWSLFKGGALQASIDAAEASEKGAYINYEKTVLEALEEAETSLTRYGREWQTLKSLKSSEKTRQTAFEIAFLRYSEGEENFLVVLDAERSLVSVQDGVIQSETRILSNLTQLYKALGGSWTSGVRKTQ